MEHGATKLFIYFTCVQIHIMRNIEPKENEMEIRNKIADRIIINLKCANNIILMVGIEENLILSY